jgi:hypothetical protein
VVGRVFLGEFTTAVEVDAFGAAARCCFDALVGGGGGGLGVCSSSSSSESLDGKSDNSLSSPDSPKLTASSRIAFFFVFDLVCGIVSGGNRSPDDLTIYAE